MGLLMWSIIAVQIFHPINRQITMQGLHGDCERCPRAWSSVWMSFVTLSQTLLFGDGWGESAIIVIEQHFWTLFLFLGALSSVSVGAMNLILAAIVDSGA